MNVQEHDVTCCRSHPHEPDAYCKGERMNEANGRFWMVFNDSLSGRAPTYKHPTQESAKQEAERLAKQNPGTRFWVLEAQGFMQITPPTIWTPAEDGMPF